MFGGTKMTPLGFPQIPAKNGGEKGDLGGRGTTISLGTDPGGKKLPPAAQKGGGARQVNTRKRNRVYRGKSGQPKAFGQQWDRTQ